MLARENAQGPSRHPSWRYFLTENGTPFWGCRVTGALSAEEPAKPTEWKGGFFCDEPVNALLCDHTLDSVTELRGCFLSILQDGLSSAGAGRFQVLGKLSLGLSVGNQQLRQPLSVHHYFQGRRITCVSILSLSFFSSSPCRSNQHGRLHC